METPVSSVSTSTASTSGSFSRESVHIKDLKELKVNEVVQRVVEEVASEELLAGENRFARWGKREMSYFGFPDRWAKESVHSWHSARKASTADSVTSNDSSGFSGFFESREWETASLDPHSPLFNPKPEQSSEFSEKASERKMGEQLRRKGERFAKESNWNPDKWAEFEAQYASGMDWYAQYASWKDWPSYDPTEMAQELLYLRAELAAKNRRLQAVRNRKFPEWDPRWQGSRVGMMKNGIQDYGKVREWAPSKNFTSSTTSLGTSLMLKNLPNKYSRDQLLHALKDFKACIDFLYMPIDFNSHCNVGYAFLNFRKESDAERFTEKFDFAHNKDVLPGFKSEKVCRVAKATIQGKEHNIERLRKSPQIGVLKNNPQWQPLLFDSEGEKVPFPFEDPLKREAVVRLC